MKASIVEENLNCSELSVHAGWLPLVYYLGSPYARERTGWSMKWWIICKGNNGADNGNWMSQRKQFLETLQKLERGKLEVVHEIAQRLLSSRLSERSQYFSFVDPLVATRRVVVPGRTVYLSMVSRFISGFSQTILIA